MILPKELAKTLPKSRLLTENEWRGIGVQQSRGWQHYALHRYVWLHMQKNQFSPMAARTYLHTPLSLHFDQHISCAARNHTFYYSVVSWVPTRKRVGLIQIWSPRLGLNSKINWD